MKPRVLPNIIPPRGPNGNIGSKPASPPVIPNAVISGINLLRFLRYLLGITPPWRSPFISLPNNHCCIASLFLVNAIPAPTEAPSKGPPIAPVTNEIPPPTNPPPKIFGAYSDIFLVVSFITLPKALVDLSESLPNNDSPVNLAPFVKSAIDCCTTGYTFSNTLD